MGTYLYSVEIISIGVFYVSDIVFMSTFIRLKQNMGWIRAAFFNRVTSFLSSNIM